VAGLKDTLQGGLDSIKTLGSTMRKKVQSDLNSDKSLDTETPAPKLKNTPDGTDVNKLVGDTASFVANRTGRAAKTFVNDMVPLGRSAFETDPILRRNQGKR
jgi:hypothetical protein